MQGDWNPAAEMFDARDARNATDEARGETQRIARRMAECVCFKLVLPAVIEQAETGGDATKTLVVPIDRLMGTLWGEYPCDATCPAPWVEWEADRDEWGVVADAGAEAYTDERQPWNRPGNPYRLSAEELRRMLSEAGYRAHAGFEVRTCEAGHGDGTMYALRVTVGW